MSGRNPNRTWVALAAAILAFGVVRTACVRFPAAPARPVAVGLREQLASLAPYDARALASLSASRERLSAAALNRRRVAEVCAGLASSWEVGPVSFQPHANLTPATTKLRQSDAGDYRALLRRIRQVQELPEVSVVGASVSANGGRLLAELEIMFLTHTQPEDENSSGVLAIVPNEEKR